MECNHCRKKATARRVLSSECLCGDCEKVVREQEEEIAAIKSRLDGEETDLIKDIAKDEVTVGSTDFWGNMKKLLDTKFDNFEQTIAVKLNQKIKEEVKVHVEKETADIRKELVAQKKESKKLSDEVIVLKSKLEDTITKLNSVEKSHIDNGTVTKNNLKYLVNTDRNRRAHNIIIFGLEEKVPLKILEIEGVYQELNEFCEEDKNIVDENIKWLHTDEEKVLGILKYLGIPQASNSTHLSESIRMGRVEGKRSLKIVFTNTDIARKIIAAAPKLKSAKKLQIFIKPDKTKGEREEFSRLLQRKKELMDTHPPIGGNQSRISLTKGILKVDGVQVDEFKPPQSIF